LCVLGEKMGIASSRNIDNETLLLLAKIKRISKHNLGIQVDVVQVANDQHHARELLNLLATSGNDELFQISLGLMQKLELFEAMPEITI